MENANEKNHSLINSRQEQHAIFFIVTLPFQHQHVNDVLTLRTPSYEAFQVSFRFCLLVAAGRPT